MAQAQEVATLEIIDDSLDWNPPAALPLNLRSHLQKFGIGSDDLVIIEGLPEGADFTVGVCKPDGSWSLRAAEIDNAAFIPLYGNGETYTLKVCLLTPDPSDHGLPKMKGKAQFPLAVPLAPLPVLVAFEEVAPKKAAPAVDAVIHLGADPALKAAAQATPPAPKPAAAVPGSAAEFERRLAAARQQWQAEEAARLAEAVEEWRADAAKQRTALEAKLADSYRERLAAIESAMNAKDGTPSNADAAAVKRAVAEARAAWEIEEGARRAKDAADLTAAHQRQVAQLEAQHAALHDMRMTAADAAWRKAEAERLAAAELAWSKREAERLAAIEAKWRAENDQRLSLVLANLDTMVKGQLGNIDGSQPLPAIEPTLAAPATTPADDRGSGESPTIDGWRKTAAGLIPLSPRSHDVTMNGAAWHEDPSSGLHA